MSRSPKPAFLALSLTLALVFVSAAAWAAPILPPELDPLVRNLDPSLRPGNDFFRYATGTWVKNHPIPPNEQEWSVGSIVVDEVRGQLRGICESAAASGAPAGSNEQKVGDFWVAGMDSAAIETRGLTPLQPELARIDSIRTRTDLLRMVAELQLMGAGPIYGCWIGQDDKNSAAYIVTFTQAGIGLPDRDYYFASDSSTARIRTAYPVHVATVFRLLGDDATRAEDAARSVLAIETALAAGSRTIEALRDPYANYHKMSMKELLRLAPDLDLPAQLRLLGLPPVDSVDVGQPEFYSHADSTLLAQPLEAWKDYLRWNLVHTFASYLSSPFDRESFRFYGTLIDGTPQQRPRWKRVLRAEDGAIGELLGEVWVRKYCSPATKARYDRLADDIFSSFRDRIQRLTWMSAPTKEKALGKLSRVIKKIGYPDHWRDYSALSIDRTSYVADVIRCNQWWFRYYAAKLGHPVDRTEWGMTPQTVNAYYDDSNNEIVVPAAAFLIPGVPDSLIDDALLYSYSGASTLGHELTHGFDDDGRQYDADGNMKPWWTPQDSTEFARRAGVLVKQFDSYTVGDKHVRGYATLGENIADLGGLVIGYDAFRKTEEWKSGRKINGLTPDQRFFLGYALSWTGQDRPEALIEQVMTDVHSPRALRVNGPFSDIPAFYRAFGIKPGDAMYRDEKNRASIW